MDDTDSGQWLTYRELGDTLGITSAAARMYAARRGWPRRAPNAPGGRSRVLVPDVLKRAEARERPVLARMNGGVPAHDQIERAITALSEALTAERERSEKAEQRADRLRRRIEELQAELGAERRRVIEILTGERAPWWRRWFRG